MIPDPAVSRARRFAEQVVMVTGAGGGIGSAICERFAKEGASVYACDVAAPATEVVVTQLRREGASVETAFLASGRSPHTTGATIDITGADYVR